MHSLGVGARRGARFDGRFDGPRRGPAVGAKFDGFDGFDGGARDREIVDMRGGKCMLSLLARHSRVASEIT